MSRNVVIQAMFEYGVVTTRIIPFSLRSPFAVELWDGSIRIE